MGRAKEFVSRRRPYSGRVNRPLCGFAGLGLATSMDERVSEVSIHWVEDLRLCRLVGVALAYSSLCPWLAH